jgi:DNA transformation protein and related proteins
MAVSPSFRDFVLEQFGQVARVTTRPMFGGLTFFHDGKAFALIDGDRLYFKVDDSNRGDFVDAGCGPFLPFGDPEKPMAYYELPGEVLEDPEVLAAWMGKAFAVAGRVRTKAPSGRRKR